jgi:hypothetical protein
VVFVLAVLLPLQALFILTRTTQGVEHYHVHGAGSHVHEHRDVARHFHADGVKFIAVDDNEARYQTSLRMNDRSRESVVYALLTLVGFDSFFLPASAAGSAVTVIQTLPRWFFAYRLERPPRGSTGVRQQD